MSNWIGARGRQVLRVVSAALVVSGTLQVAVSAPAEAYDANSCHWEMRSDVDVFRGDHGVVDAGDDMHLDGRPHGNAVVCWPSSGRHVDYHGKVYWDSYGAGCSKAEIDVIRSDGVGVSFQDTIVCSTGGLRSRNFDASYFGPVGTRLRAVRVRLLSRPTGQADFELVRSFGVAFGD